MDLPMAVRMQQHPIGRTVCSPVGAPDDMVAVPARHLGDGLLAYRTDALLLPPQIQQAAPSLQGIRHLHPQAGFEVALPRRVIGVCRCFDFDMPLDWCISQAYQPVFLGFALARRYTMEDPVVVGHSGEILLAYPSGRLVGMPSLGP